MEYPGKNMTYLNSHMVVEAYFVPKSKAKTSTGSDKTATKAEKQAEYVQKLPETLSTSVVKIMIQAKHVVVLLWNKFEIFYREKQKFFGPRELDDKFTVPKLRQKLRDAMKANPTVLVFKSEE